MQKFYESKNVHYHWLGFMLNLYRVSSLGGGMGDGARQPSMIYVSSDGLSLTLDITKTWKDKV